MGAFYVDQKKKDLLPSTLPSEHEQWGSFVSVDNESFIILPISATPIQVVVVDMASSGIPLCLSTSGYAVGKFKVVGVRVDQSPSPLWGHWIAVCN